MELISQAAESGCDAVKFQYRNIDRAYASKNEDLEFATSEIGDEIVSAEIRRNFISPSEILRLTTLAKIRGLEVGISFFSTEDFHDFSDEQHEYFDFYKVPSAELMNEELVDRFLSTGKITLISLGMHNEQEIEQALERISAIPNWLPLHCVSNYPVALHNAQLGYIQRLKRTWKRDVGYSSHDADWETVLLALALGAKVVERHITLDKDAAGLDHSTSSTPAEFKRISAYLRQIERILDGDEAKLPNQGEILNRQNLGRSFFAVRYLKAGSLVSRRDFVYASPKTGLGYADFHKAIGMKLTRDIQPGDVLSETHIRTSEIGLTDVDIDFAIKNMFSLPIRFGDYKQIMANLPVSGFEFHLSFEEALSDTDAIEIDRSKNYTVHSPDYINPHSLIDPFSEDNEIRGMSQRCLERVASFADRIASETGKNVVVVNSLSSRTLSRALFYEEVQNLFSRFSSSRVTMSLQWLPPFAWYFGGSIKLEQMNSISDLEYLTKFRIPVTLDSSHLLMCRNYDGTDPFTVISELHPLIVHAHVSDATGIDGEGSNFDYLSSSNYQVHQTIIKMPIHKVLEVWQGHLDNQFGFKSAIKQLRKLDMDNRTEI